MIGQEKQHDRRYSVIAVVMSVIVNVIPLVFEICLVTGVSRIWVREAVELLRGLVEYSGTAVFKGFNELLGHLIARRTLHYVDDRVVIELHKGDEDSCYTGYISYNYGNLEYDNSKDEDGLLKIFEEVEPGKGSHNIHGLTALSPHISMKTMVKYDNLDSGRYCFYPQTIEVKLWYEPKVYILNSLQPGTCRFNITVRHEQTHLDLGHSALYFFAQRVKQKLPQIIKDVGPRVESDNNSGENLNMVAQYLNQDYQKQLEELFLQFKENLDSKNAIIDSVENYQYETLLCQ